MSTKMSLACTENVHVYKEAFELRGPIYLEVKRPQEYSVLPSENGPTIMLSLDNEAQKALRKALTKRASHAIKKRS